MAAKPPPTTPSAVAAPAAPAAPGPTLNLAVLTGPCSGPPEVRVLESGTRLATLAVRCPAGAGPTSGSRRSR